MDRKIKVLYIDDEPNNLISFKASFRRDFDVFLASSTDEAFQTLQSHPDIVIIISDQRMPQKTGVQFFEEIRSVNPGPVRMLCTGYTDIEAVIDAINKGHIFRFIQKPWTENEIRMAIEEGYSYYLATSELAQKHTELLKVNAELDKFSNSVTHELRSPITSVINAVNIAHDSKDTNEVRELLGMVQTSLARLDNFICSIQDYYSINRGELKIEEVNFESMISNLRTFYEINQRTNGVEFRIKTEINSKFMSDSTVISIILNNLLSNAFKYQRSNSDRKEVTLDLQVNDNMANISVRDNGIGIDKDYLNSIFDMFFRGTNESFGSGFGLYNAKDALDKLGGTISVSSEKNQGTVFNLVIPGSNGTS